MLPYVITLLQFTIKHLFKQLKVEDWQRSESLKKQVLLLLCAPIVWLLLKIENRYDQTLLSLKSLHAAKCILAQVYFKIQNSSLSPRKYQSSPLKITGKDTRKQ